ncbi:lysosomal acid lipase/cholesteryl ester hydrolase-like [Haemaphysalis longicornis]
MAALFKYSPLLAIISALVGTSPCTGEDELSLQARLTPCELIKYMGYPCEISYANTEDGYILEMDRVPNGLNGTTPGAGNTTSRYPVLFLPAFSTASDNWFLNYPSQTPGFLFADAGFDVWSMNSRESEPYASHKTLSKKDREYWRWSFDEIGRYDVAAAIDHVLNATGAEKLTLVGVSQGVTISLVLLSTRPEYNDKIDLFVAYGPVANVSHTGFPFSLALPVIPAILLVLDPLSLGGYLKMPVGLQRAITAVCRIISGEVCSLSITLTVLSSPRQLNETRLPMYAGHFPIGTSYQNLRHYNQMYRSRNFQMYDHGRIENRRRYGQSTPPPYPVERVTAPVAVFSSEGDTVAHPRDVELLVASLGDSVVFRSVVPEKTLRHFDFANGYRTKEFLHNVAIDLIRQYATQST